MSKRAIFFGLLAGTLLSGLSVNAQAATGNPSLGRVAAAIADVTDVRWVCGPYRCAWIPNYRGRVVVYPHMRGWVAALPALLLPPWLISVGVDLPVTD